MMNSRNLDNLIDKLAAGELTVAERLELMDAAVSDEQAADAMAMHLWLDPLLRDCLHDDSDAFAHRIQHCVTTEGDTTEFVERVQQRMKQKAAGRRKRWLFASVAVVALLAVAIIGSTVFRNADPRPTTPVARLKHVSGEVFVVTDDGQRRQVDGGDQIRSGETVRTQGPSTVAVVYSDGTRLVMLRDASITCTSHRGKTVFVHEGLVSANVAPQPPSEPMIVATPHAKVYVMGTKFVLASTTKQTDLTVAKGRVKFTQSDGQSVEIPEGHSATADAKSKLVAKRGPAVPDTWSQDFERGLPETCEHGTFVDEGLPVGSKGGVTSGVHRFDGRAYHEIWPDNDWAHGQFVNHVDTHLHVTYKLERPGRVQIFSLHRIPQPDTPVAELFVLDPSDLTEGEFWWDVPAGKWFTASIPYQRFRSMPGRRKPPTVGNITVGLNFSSQEHDRGLVIDKIWVTRGGPRRIEYKELD